LAVSRHARERDLLTIYGLNDGCARCIDEWERDMPQATEKTTTRLSLEGFWRCPTREEFAPTILEGMLLVAGLVVPTVVTAVYFVLLGGAAAIWQQLAYGVGKGIQFLLPVAWRATMPKTQTSETKVAFGIDLAVGAGIGLAIAAGMLAFHFVWLREWFATSGVTEAVRNKMASIGVGSPVALIALGVFYSIVHSGLEEYYWRWFAFQGLRRTQSVPAAVAISCLAFAAHHVLILGQFFGMTNPFTWLLSASVACGGIIWALQYQKTGRLAGCWLSHGIVDAAIFVVGFDMAYGASAAS
jgi:membrane protease YdiL (CAAX protease family)